MEFLNNHRKLFSVAFWFFVVLTLFVAVIPALTNQENNAPLPNAIPLSADARAGKDVFIANGCVACHTQQVRNIDMDKLWGTRPSTAADYAANTRTDFWRNTATLMGTERTGPDLTNIGNRQPSQVWNLLHLFQPRAVVAGSIMPAYPWLFEVKNILDTGDIEIVVPDQFRKGITGKIVATKEGLQLVAYLQSLKQTPLPDGTPAPGFLYPKETKGDSTGETRNAANGKELYAANCQSCHQENGEGLKGAFPPLKGSLIATGDSLGLYLTIIMQGYDARPEYAVMPAVGINNNLTPEEITAIINYERTSWGNHARTLSVEEVKKIMESLKPAPVQ